MNKILCITLAAVAGLASPEIVTASSLTWSNNAGDSTWNTSSINWSNVGNTTWTAGSDAVFDATGAGSITVSGNIQVGTGSDTAITFKSAGYTLTGGAILLPTASVSSTNTSTFAMNADATIASVVTGGSNNILSIGGNGTLTLNPGAGQTDTFGGLTIASGGVTLTGGVLALSATRTGLAQGNGLNVLGGTMTLTGGTLSTLSYTSVSKGGVMNVSGGTYNANGGTFVLGYNAGYSGTLNLSGSGIVDLGSFRTSQNGNGIANLNGGTLKLTSFLDGGTGTGTVNFNGTTVIAKQNMLTFTNTTRTNYYVFEGGAIFDTNDRDITINAALQSGAAIDGGLKKKGAGTLTLTAASTYNGATTVTEGTLALGSAGSVSKSSSISVSAGATFDVSAHSGVYSVVSSQTLNNNGTVKGDLDVAGILKGGGSVTGAAIVNGTLAPGNSIGTMSVGDLTLASTSIFEVELGRNGLIPTSDRVDVTGSVNIVNGANLRLALYGAATPQMNDIFFLINNDGTLDAITGVFTELNGITTTLTEGSRFTWNSQQWEITYRANVGTSSFTGGNDLALMIVPEPSTWAMLVGGMGLLAFGQRMRRHS